MQPHSLTVSPAASANNASGMELFLPSYCAEPSGLVSPAWTFNAGMQSCFVGAEPATTRSLSHFFSFLGFMLIALAKATADPTPRSSENAGGKLPISWLGASWGLGLFLGQRKQGNSIPQRQALDGTSSLTMGYSRFAGGSG